MENPLAQKTFTVKKIINGKTLNFTLQIDKALTQKYIRDKKTYAPDFTKTPLIFSIGFIRQSNIKREWFQVDADERNRSDSYTGTH